MDDREMHLAHLRAAGGQFRLATAARLAVTMGHQPLDLPIQWSWPAPLTPSRFEVESVD
jgi:hypothetical protein